MLTKSEIKSLKSLQMKKFREEEKCFLVEGKRSVEEAINFNHGIDVVLISHEFAENHPKLTEKFTKLHVRMEIVNSKDIDSISDVKNSQGIVAKVKYFEYNIHDMIKAPKTKKRIVILDSVSDPGNMGTIMRTADWFGIDAIISSNNSVDIYNPKVVRSCMGSIFHLPVLEAESTAQLINLLHGSGFAIYAADLNGTNYREVNYPEKVAMVFGNEAHGISTGIKDMIDRKITIPKAGMAESLNVAVSAGIILANFNN